MSFRSLTATLVLCCAAVASADSLPDAQPVKLGPLNELRSVIFWSLWLFVGTQILFSSVFLSMLGISRGTYIGDYELK